MMKKIAVYLVLTFVFISLLHSQTPDSLNTLKGEEISFYEFAQHVEKSHHVRIYYQKEWVSGIKIPASLMNIPLEEALTRILKDTDYTFFSYQGNKLVLLEKTYAASLSGALADAKKTDYNNGSTVVIGDKSLQGKYKTVSFKGYVRDGKTGEYITGASIYVKNINEGTITNQFGYFSLEIPAGENDVDITFMGFQSVSQKILACSPGQLDVELFEETVAIDEVVITSYAAENVSGAEMSIVRLDARSIEKLPVLMGETDLIKTMVLLPGVQSSGEMSSGFNVRGGNTDQNLILLDDVPIYNSTHLFGMFSMINSNAIQNVQLHKGGAPASYGGRVSSVMDVKMREGSYKKYTGSAGIGILYSKAYIEGPVVKDKASFLIGGRTTYSDWLLKMMPDIDLKKSNANFYDANAKININLSKKNRISLFGYISNDRLDLASKTIYSYGNKLFSLKWDYLFHEKLAFKLSGVYSEYNTEVTEQESQYSAFSISSGIKQYGGKLKFLYYPGTSHNIELGADAYKYTFNRGEKMPYGDSSLIISEKLEPETALEVGIFLQEKFNLSHRLSVSAGVRYSLYQLYGESVVNRYQPGLPINEIYYIDSSIYNKGDIVQSYAGFEPRVSLKISVDKHSSVKLGYNRSMQYLQMISNTSVATPTDIWKSCDTYIKPQTGDQAAIGYFRNFNKNVIETSLELYYKRVNNILDYKNGAVLIMNEYLERDILLGDAESYGIEVMVKKNTGRITGWLSYTYSRSYRTVNSEFEEEQINSGKQFPSNFDKPHDLTIVGNYQISRNWNLSANFVYSTGRPATFPEIKYSMFGNEIVYYSERNKYRLPDYHRMDLSLTYENKLKADKKISTSWTFSVYNVYGQDNIYSVFFKKAEPSMENGYNPFSLYKLTIIGVPIPSLTLNIKF